MNTWNRPVAAFWAPTPARWGRSLMAVAVALAAVALAFASPAGLSAPLPLITSLRTEGTNLFLAVNVPHGMRRLTLECRGRVDPDDKWDARDLRWPDGDAGEFHFVIPLSRKYELFRIRGADTNALPLPARFYQGKSDFGKLVQPGQEALNRQGAPGAPTDAAVGNTPPTADSSSSARSVVESDIWQVSGSTLYYFNQNRGLQVVDISNPDNPILKGTLPLAWAGEQMYVLPDAQGGSSHFVALLAHDPCKWEYSEIILVRIDDGIPVESGRLHVDGQIKESRLVGDVIYTAAYKYVEHRSDEKRDASGNVVSANVWWENVTTVASYNLANPAKPYAVSSVTLESNPSAIFATDRILCVAMEGFRYPKPGESASSWMIYGNYSVQLFDISDPAGTIRKAGSVVTAGRVADKFKMHIRGNVLYVASHKEGRWISRPVLDASGRWIRDDGFAEEVSAWLQTFSIENLDSPAKLDSLKLIQNELTYATRFDGDRAYVVTFRRVDPLWVVDLSDPAHLRVRGELEVPGVSTYIEPMGDRLVTMGQENIGVAVSLFDVSDPAKPSLLSRVSLGKWSWSEANSDEKAFRVIPAAGLILVPWSGMRDSDPAVPASSANFFQGIQLIDLNRDSLKARGVIEHKMQARRATLHANRILSVSGTELLAADATDRDKPVVTASLELAASFDRVLIVGDKLVALTGANAYENRPASVRVLGQQSQDLTLGLLSLGDAAIVGHSRRGNTLWVLQKSPDAYRDETILVTNSVVEKSDVPGGALKTNVVVTKETRSIRIAGPGFLTAVDLSKLPSLSVRGQAKFQFHDDYWGASLDALWPDEGTLVWTEAGVSYWGPVFYDAMPGASGGAAMPALGGGINRSFWWGGTTTRTLIPFDVRDPVTPKPGTILILNGANEPHPTASQPLTEVNFWRSFSRAFVGGGRILVSHQNSWYHPGTGFWKPDPANPDNKYGQWSWSEEPRSEFAHYLDVITFPTPATPSLQPAIGFPGVLQGAALEGALLYSERSSVAITQGAKPGLDVLAFDGDKVSLAAGFDLPETYPHPYAVLSDGSILSGRASADGTQGSVELWKLTADARLTKAASASLKIGPVENLRVYGDLVLGDRSDALSFLRVGGDAGIQTVDSWARPCGIWYDLNSSDATWSAGLWVARGYSGLWHVPIQP